MMARAAPNLASAKVVAAARGVPPRHIFLYAAAVGRYTLQYIIQHRVRVLLGRLREIRMHVPYPYILHSPSIGIYILVRSTGLLLSPFFFGTVPFSEAATWLQSCYATEEE